MLRDVTVADIEAARERIAPYVLRTPLVRLQYDGKRPIYLKLENLQPVGSFKVRPGANAVLSRPVHERANGFVTASAGNFAQGLAYAAGTLSLPVTAVVPDTCARSKVDALHALNAQIVQRPYSEWWKMLMEPPLQWEGKTFIHPVCDTTVISGNGTIGLEIFEDLPDVDTVIVPYGGGALAVGIAFFLKAMRSSIRVLACESEAGQPVAAALAAGGPQTVPFDSKTFITGMGSSRVLDAMWPFVHRLLDGAVEVSLAETARTIRSLMLRHHFIAEGAGAAPVAAAIKGVPGHGAVVCIISGGHLDAEHIRAILAGAEQII